MNAARFVPIPFEPLPARLQEFDREARRVRDLCRRERELERFLARAGYAETPSPFYGRVSWSFGPGVLTIAYNAGDGDK